MVFVVSDNQWREWNSYPTLGACQQHIAMHTRYREDKIKAYCLLRKTDEDQDKSNKAVIGD